MVQYINSLIEKLKSVFNNLLRRKSFNKILYVDAIKDVMPKLLMNSYLYIIHTNGNEKWLKYNCPCGCGELISINLMKSHNPYWVIKKNTDGTLSLSPSVNMTSRCKSHYFIKSNKIEWI